MYPPVRKYPKMIVVREVPWRVRFCRKVPDGPDLLGLCDPASQTIYIKLKQKPKDTFMTFVHEVLHIFENEYDFDIPHKIIEQLEKPIAEFMAENWDLMLDMLVDRLEG